LEPISLNTQLSSQLLSKTDLPADEVMKFTDPVDLDVFLRDNKNTTQVGLLFNITTIDGTRHYQYAFQVNGSEIRDDSLEEINPQTTMVVPIQARLQLEILRFELGNPNVTLEVDMAPYPHSEIFTLDSKARCSGSVIAEICFPFFLQSFGKTDLRSSLEL
jgi:hypothetical protein